MNKIFILMTSSGEGSCFDSGSSSCAYTQYCAYHGHFSSGGQNVIYANEPYANATGCLAGGQTSPNQDVGDYITTGTSHEMLEAATDPLLDAWYDGSGNEIGDLVQLQFRHKQLDQPGQQYPCESVHKWLVLGGPDGIQQSHCQLRSVRPLIAQLKPPAFSRGS